MSPSQWWNTTLRNDAGVPFREFDLGRSLYANLRYLCVAILTIGLSEDLCCGRKYRPTQSHEARVLASHTQRDHNFPIHDFIDPLTLAIRSNSY